LSDTKTNGLVDRATERGRQKHRLTAK